MLICILYLLLCLGVEVFIVVNIIDRLADRDYLFAACFLLFFFVYMFSYGYRHVCNNLLNGTVRVII